MLHEYVLCHYGEIALKGKNRNFFEKHLIENIKKQFETFCPASHEYVKKMSGGILIKLNKKGTENEATIKDALMHTFGIANFSFATSVPQDIETIKKYCWNLIKHTSVVDFPTFRVTTQRSNKKFPMTSEEIDRVVGGHIYENFKRKFPVSMKNAAIECKIFILNDFALISLEKIAGLGGLPVGTGNKALALLSGGFDSPVAAWQVLKRGVQLRYVHFHSVPYTSKASIEKVVALKNELKKFGSATKLYLVPFADVQKEIIMKTPEKFRVILYRRMMMRIAENLAKRQKCLALITGDSIGQVASQTLENILTVSDATTLPIFRPLIGLDKEEIMQKAKAIGTFDISILPHDDCCTRLMPKKPETRSRLHEVLEAESLLDVEAITKQALTKVELV
ncbi:MAG: tRNA uracil 4-sulfurtransferase ThiI [bacterium]